MKTCDFCGENKTDVLDVRRVTGNRNWGISDPYPCALCADCEQCMEICEHCSIVYDEIAASRSTWVSATPNYGQGTDIQKITEEMSQIFFCDACVEKILNNNADAGLSAWFKKLEFWRVIEKLLAGT